MEVSSWNESDQIEALKNAKRDITGLTLPQLLRSVEPNSSGIKLTLLDETTRSGILDQTLAYGVCLLLRPL